jgi:hypothetical protein
MELLKSPADERGFGVGKVTDGVVLLQEDGPNLDTGSPLQVGTEISVKKEKKERRPP